MQMILNHDHADVIFPGKGLDHGNIAPRAFSEPVVLAHDERIGNTAVKEHVPQIIFRLHVLYFIEV